MERHISGFYVPALIIVDRETNNINKLSMYYLNFKMLIRYISDIHLELLDSAKIQEYINAIKLNGEDVCVLAGDIGQPNDLFMNHISQIFPKMFIIAGNHEHYNTGRSVEQTTEFLANYYKKFPNISFLNNSVEYYKGYCFVGTTLWSHITMPNYEINEWYTICM